MANIKSQILIQMQNFYGWDIKMISQSDIISGDQLEVKKIFAMRK
jgi:hypothetical protein